MYKYFIVYNYTDHKTNKGTLTDIYEVDNPLDTMDLISELEDEIRQDRYLSSVLVVNFILLDRN